MLMPDKSYFEIKDSDDDYVILNKKYLMSRYNISTQIQESQKLNDFNKKYDDIKQMRNKTTLDKLKLQYALEEILEN